MSDFDRVSDLCAGEWSRFFRTAVSPRVLQTPSLADGAHVYSLCDQSGAPQAVVLCSQAAHPDAVQASVECAQVARRSLGPELGKSILEPVVQGRIDGKSYAVMPFCTSLSSARFVSRIHNHLVRDSLLAWIQVVGRATRHAGSAEQLERVYSRPLRHLVKTLRADGPLLRIAGVTLKDLESGAWQPRFVLMHGDLWRGNVMMPGRPRAMLRALRSGAFAVIDWGGSDPDGIPFFDLLRALDSFGASKRTVRSYLHTYSAALESPTTDAPKYLASAWAYVLANSAHMPRELFETAQQRSFDLLGRAMPA